MVNAEKNETTSVDNVTPIKSSISININENDDVTDYFALSYVHSQEIKQYIADNFKKEINDFDIMNLSLYFCYLIVVTDDDKKSEFLKDISDIFNDDYKKNEYIFTRLAAIKSWNETTAVLKDTDDVSEKEFNDLMKKK